ncbi:telomere repeats-binding bouquet formation protein 2 isoform X1 [Ictalurus punctatus]|uniref:Telomere repeats-binding bouquet formation protein 2 isoform X1 n=1 Tax=Ictalurus punctatus TaxID=7998 RepID=A0A2D0Q6R8_ICTPU|nr:telomere repeats-binding bouquet formation protein 2 isoform X1 [Ictalurus punctatus]
MFKNKTAWFSDSVKRDIPRFWVSEGGVISDWKTADYLFSDEASCPDTKRIHVSDEYVMDRATVFHSAYLSTCRLRRSTKSVPLGHYLLPPVSIQREVKAKIGRFIWEQDEMLGVTTPHGNRSTGQMLNIQPDAKGSQTEKRNKRQENRMNTSPSTDESVCCEAQLYPVNNMVSGYVHIDQLKRFSGELHDFLPSHSGYSVSRSHSRRLPYQYKEGH